MKEKNNDTDLKKEIEKLCYRFRNTKRKIIIEP